MKEVKQTAMPSEIKAAICEVMANFEAFKSANDERLHAMETKRQDGLLDQKLDRIEMALQSAEQRLSRLGTQSTRPSLSLNDEQAIYKKSISASEVKSAFDSYMRTGHQGLEVKAGISSLSGSSALAPSETERYIERRLAAVSPMRSLASVRQIGASVFKKPVSIINAASGWVSESQARPETDPATLSLLTFPSGELYASPSATQDILDDALINIDEWLASEIEDSFASQENAAFVSGDGINKPQGFLSYTTVADSAASWGQIGYVPSGAAGGFSITNPQDALIDLIYAPKARYRVNASFVMNRRTATKIRKFKDADGNYIWQPAQMAGQLPLLLGYRVQEMEEMPDIAGNSLSIAFGDFAKGYLIVDRAGLSILRDPYSAKPYVLFYTTKRVGGGVQNFDAIKVMKFAVS